MAGAKPGVHVVQLKPNSVPDALRNGSKFVMWNDNSSAGTPVTLRVDEKGSILFWKDLNKEMDFLDIALIRDTRTAKYARVPKDGKLRESLQMGQKDVSLEDKTVSICYGSDMVNVDWMNFVSNDRDTAKLWAEELLRYAGNLLSANSSTLVFLEKWYSRIISVLGPDGKIPVKNVVKQVASNREDKKKVEKALEAAGLLVGKSDSLDPSKFNFQNFFNFYHQLVGRTEVDTIFAEMGAKKKPYLTVEQFTEFLNWQQRDPRLNEILYPFATVKQAQEIINQHEAKGGMAAKGHLSLEGFLMFLLSEENNVIPAEKLDLSEDMSQPLAHYFINSSHNTYLTGHQFTGKSSVEIYRQVLLCGCRCVELDCWDGKGQDEEPVITHGYTMCTEVPFKDVVEAIAESAFKTSDYPVILSFENHCGPKQQAKMANYCRTIFGEMLLDMPLDSHPLKPDVPLPSPLLLKRKILVKNKKKHFHKVQNQKSSSASKGAGGKGGDSSSKPKSTSDADEGSGGGTSTEGEGGGDMSSPSSPTGRKTSFPDGSPTRAVLEKNVSVCSEGGEKGGEVEVFESESDSSESEDEEDDDEEEEEGEEAVEMTEEEKRRRQRVKRDKGTAGKEAEAAMEMSALVNYIQPIHFHSFESSEKRNKSYEISSFVETQALAQLKESPVDFVNYNKRQLSRIYPRGTRVDSSNFMPQVYWNAGCQLVALNYQTLDLAMQINLGIFEYNGRSGYILKPDFMRRNDRRFDPFAESTVDGIVAGTVTVKVISGQFLSDKRVGTYVEVDMYGLPTDTVRKKFRTKTVPNNGLNPVYDEEPFVFKKVVLPNLAIVRLGVYEETGKLIGHRIMPVEGLRPGFRHIPLRNEANQALMLPTIFVHIIINDYVPDQFAAYADALLNPIAYLSQLEKHAQQLEILTEDFESDDAKAAKEEDGDTAGDPLPNTAIKEMDDKMQRRQNSLNTKPTAAAAAIAGGGGGGGGGGAAAGAGGEKSTATSSTSRSSLNRLPSAQHIPVSKQESSQSSASVTSSQSGRMLKLSQSNLTLLLFSSVPKVTSSVDWTTGYYARNSKLNDPSLLTPMPLDELKNSKTFQKALAKKDKELDSIRRKHDKSREMMEEQHQIQLDKLIAAQTKARISMEKLHTKTLKKMQKNKEDSEGKKQVFMGELQGLLQAQGQELRGTKYKHADVMMALNRDHLQAQLDVHKRHHSALYDALFEAMAASQAAHRKRLDETHAHDVLELKKKRDPQIREHMKLLARKHTDKHELSRIKREEQQKHVDAVVTERQELNDLLDKRKGELQSKLDEVRKEAEKDKDQYLKHHMEDFQQKCQQLQEQFDKAVKDFGMEEDDDDDDEEEEEGGNLGERNALNQPSTDSPERQHNGDDNTPQTSSSALLLNGATSPLQEPQQQQQPQPPEQEASVGSKGDSPSKEKINSKEELTSM
ncbi:1-phosphatidylinositol 4,5-bisphosphate phosphodiesterase beta-1-like [Babylonia areolata]|uniref:1-phosphatidylinositol 4,5-bisphosphate phosphodiesterase beta-1-like n=1 Tax=Babylonia areolata TaxID=304850 RepID=UPI003FD6590F